MPLVVNDPEALVDEPALDPNDPIRSHRVAPQPPKSGQTVVLEAMVTGTPVVALCGYTWVPSRDPQRHPKCEKCEAILERIRHRGSN